MARLTFTDRLQDSVRRISRRELGRVRRRLSPPTLPKRADGRVLLHLGCGGINAPGFVNVDGMSAPHIHIVGPIDDLGVFADASVDLVYASHCLEHFSYHHVGAVLREWTRVLRPGGMLRIAVPDVALVVKRYQLGVPLEELLGHLYGEQTYRFNFHYAGFDHALLKRHMEEAGVREVMPWQPDVVEDHPFKDDSGAVCDVAGEVVPVSLNLQGVRA
jgi:predicted SAM-dependent methyltransferase